MSDCRRQTLSKTETHHSGGLNLGAFRTDFAAQSPAWQDFERRRKEYGSRSGPSRRQTLSPPCITVLGTLGTSGAGPKGTYTEEPSPALADDGRHGGRQPGGGSSPMHKSADKA